MSEKGSIWSVQLTPVRKDAMPERRSTLGGDWLPPRLLVSEKIQMYVTEYTWQPGVFSRLVV